jgi:hypothetical protein
MWGRGLALVLFAFLVPDRADAQPIWICVNCPGNYQACGYAPIQCCPWPTQNGQWGYCSFGRRCVQTPQGYAACTQLNTGRAPPGAPRPNIHPECGNPDDLGDDPYCSLRRRN